MQPLNFFIEENSESCEEVLRFHDGNSRVPTQEEKALWNLVLLYETACEGNVRPAISKYKEWIVEICAQVAVNAAFEAIQRFERLRSEQLEGVAEYTAGDVAKVCLQVAEEMKRAVNG